MTHASILYGTAQTNTVVIATAGNERFTLRRLEVMADNANTADVGCGLGLGVSIMLQSFAGHPGIPAGSGFVEVYPEGIIEPDMGQQLLFSCETPTSGGIRVSVSYERHVFD